MTIPLLALSGVARDGEGLRPELKELLIREAARESPQCRDPSARSGVAIPRPSFARGRHSSLMTAERADHGTPFYRLGRTPSPSDRRVLSFVSSTGSELP
jgi:hypothetical protein